MKLPAMFLNFSFVCQEEDCQQKRSYSSDELGVKRFEFGFEAVLFLCDNQYAAWLNLFSFRCLF